MFEPHSAVISSRSFLFYLAVVLSCLVNVLHLKSKGYGKKFFEEGWRLKKIITKLHIFLRVESKR